MRIARQYEELQLLVKEINQRLEGSNFEKIKDLIFWLAKSEIYQKLKVKENMLIDLDFFCDIWLEEKKQLTVFGIQDDIFYGINSLADIERKYQIIKYSGLRVENQVPDFLCEEIVDELIEYRVSGIAISKIIISGTYKREENILKIAQILKEKNQIITANILLSESLKVYPENDNMLMELAECWMIGQQWKQALECLKKIKQPEMEILELIEMLEKGIEHENI